MHISINYILIKNKRLAKSKCCHKEMEILIMAYLLEYCIPNNYICDIIMIFVIIITKATVVITTTVTIF